MIRDPFLAPSWKLREWLFLLFATLTLLTPGRIVAAEPVGHEELQHQAKDAYANGRHAEAISLATRAIAVETNNPRGYFLRARFHEEQRAFTNALADYDQAIKLNANLADAWQNRGTTHFRLGRLREAIADFDQFLKLAPQQEPHHWQRGIAHYYAGRFEDGRKQFELHQTVNPNDVENAVWHFLCVARASNVEKARAALIPIRGDARVPMMEVHALFAGKLKPEDVLQAAAAGDPPPAQRQRQLFYAHLYLGLYFEALSNDKQAREHVTKAVGEYQTGDYMGDVARVHQQLRRGK